jgi:hypothetical protein
MGRRWLLSLLCLSVFVLCLVPLTRAGGDVRVNEADTKIFLARDRPRCCLRSRKQLARQWDARVEVELLDPKNKSRAKTTQIATIAKGTQKLSLFLRTTTKLHIHSMMSCRFRALMLGRST